MIRLRAIVAGIPLRFVILIASFVIVVSASTLIGAVEPLVTTHECSVDWAAAIAARESGASDYSGVCADFGGFLPTDGVPDAFRQIQADWERRANEELATLSTDLWGASGRHLAGLPLILFAVLSGALVAGSMMGSGTAAWCLSNGWNRKTWIRSVLVLLTTTVAGTYVLLTSAFVVAVLIWIRGVGLPLPLGVPGWTALAPLPGLLFYAFIGVTAGLVAGRGETAALGALIVTVGEFVLSRVLGAIPILPSSLHQVTLGSSEAPVSAWIAGPGLLGAAFLLSLLSYSFLVYRRDIPDRPL